MQEQDTQKNQATQKPAQVSMTMQVITIYCYCDDFLKAAGWHDDVQAQMTTAEVMSVSLVAAAIFNGNQEKSRRFLKEHGYIPSMLSKSQFNRRWHAVPEALWQEMLLVLGEAAKPSNSEGIYKAFMLWTASQCRSAITFVSAAVACTRAASGAKSAGATVPARKVTIMASKGTL